MKIIKQYKQTKKIKGRLPLSVYLAYLFICSFLLTGVSFSRYISTANANDSARVAKGLMTVSYDESNMNFSMSAPSDKDVPEERKFTFAVSNNTSEVAIQYDVVVTLDKPLVNGVTMTLDGDTGVLSDDKKTYEFSNRGTFAAGEEETIMHTLLFAGDYMKIPVNTDDTYDIQIEICSEQID